MCVEWINGWSLGENIQSSAATLAVGIIPKPFRLWKYLTTLGLCLSSSEMLWHVNDAIFSFEVH